MAEKLAFHQLSGNRAAVDGNKGAGFARAVFMDQPGNQFFAGAGFAVDVHRRLVAGDFADQRAGRAHHGGLAEQQRGRRRAVAGLFEPQRGLHHALQLRDFDRLGHIVERAVLQRLDGGFQIAVGGNHGNRRVGVVRLHVPDDLHAAAVGQSEVGQAQVEWLLRELPPRRLEVAGLDRLNPHPPEADGQQRQQIRAHRR